MAEVSDEGASLLITFDTETDRAGLSGLFPCSSIFVNATALGSQSLCFWRNSSSLVIRTSEDATLALGDQLTLALNVIGAQADPSLKLNSTASATVSVIGPENPLPPVGVIEGTSSIGWCDVLTLDASASYGSGGRAFVGGYQWGLVPPLDNSTDIVAQLTKYISSQTGHTVIIDGPTFQLNTTRLYNFSLTLQNWLGESTTTYYPVVITPGDQVTVRISGGLVRCSHAKKASFPEQELSLTFLFFLDDNHPPLDPAQLERNCSTPLYLQYLLFFGSVRYHQQLFLCMGSFWRSCVPS